MSNIEIFKQVKDVVLLCEAQFVSLADQKLWAKESQFALQALHNNDFLAQTAKNNLDSLRAAIINIAATGLTLNPVKRHAYLVPRDKRVCLDIGYLGYVQLAVDSGIFEFIKAELVHEKDQFIWNGIGEKPEHKMDPFGDRGEIVGVYCLAKMKDGSYITELMKVEEVYAIRDRSQSWKSGKNSPWKSDPTEMIKKTCIRRAYKSWPIPSNSREKLDVAFESIDEINEVSEVDVTPSADIEPLIEGLKERIFILDRTEAQTIEFCQRIYQRKIEALTDMTKYELEKLTAMLDQRIAGLDQEEVTQKRKDYNNEDTNTDPDATLDLPIELQLETD